MNCCAPSARSTSDGWQKNSRKTLTSVAAWVAAMGIVFWGELLPGNSAPMRFLSATHVDDKVLHFVAYTVLAAIPMIGFRRVWGVAGALSMIGAGIALEFAQRQAPGRSFEIADMVANALGVLTGIGMVWAATCGE